VLEQKWCNAAISFPTMLFLQVESSTETHIQTYMVLQPSTESVKGISEPPLTYLTPFIEDIAASHC